MENKSLRKTRQNQQQNRKFKNKKKTSKIKKVEIN